VFGWDEKRGLAAGSGSELTPTAGTAAVNARSRTSIVPGITPACFCHCLSARAWDDASLTPKARRQNGLGSRSYYLIPPGCSRSGTATRYNRRLNLSEIPTG
jgi:hypothetical protein